MSKKTFDVSASCPTCGGGLIVSRLTCDGCGTELQGRFRPNEFSRLAGEDLDFLRAFVKSRGSIKDVEQALGISYPTVRGRLEKLLDRLGLASGKEAERVLASEIADRRAEVLDQLDQGEIRNSDAETLLIELKD